MKKCFTFLLGILITSIVFGQRPTDVIMKTDTKPVIDGVLDDAIWDVANVNDLDKPYSGETPTLGTPGETNWRALWDDDGIYVFITVTDDVYLPRYAGTGASYLYDHTEIYFDTNYDLEDGLGPQPDGNGGGNGHYQFADDIKAGIDDGTMQTRTDGVQYAMLKDGTNYNEEYFIPFKKLLTGTGGAMDKTQEIGFDITVIDNDASDTPDNPVRNRVVWSNDGSITTESWGNMDECGRITLDGAEAGIPIDDITIGEGGEITQDNQTLQMVITEILPENVTDSSVVWNLVIPDGSTARATISKDGVLTPILNGDVEIYATSPDEFAESNHVIVHISGQVVSAFEVSILKNGDFVMGDDGLDFWNDITNSASAKVENGYLSIAATPQTYRWDIGLGQTLNGITDENSGDAYTLKFKAWGSNALDTIPLIIEDVNNNYPKNALIEVPAEWTKDDGSDVQLPITDEPQWFEFPVSFPNWQNNSSKYAFSFQIGMETGTFSFDSISLVNNADLQYISTGISRISNIQSFNVYPNPATSKLYVDLPTANAKVSIYNSIGVKMEEIIVSGTHHEFDVSRYKAGLYFIKANNAVVKFVR